MKREFKPEMTVVRFGAEDVIATSGERVGLTNFYDGINDNNTFSFNGKDYTISNNDTFYTFRKDLGDYVGDTSLKTAYGNKIYFGSDTVNDIYKGDHSGVDGTYTYIGGGKFRKQ